MHLPKFFELVSACLEGEGRVDVRSEVYSILGNMREGEEQVCRGTHANGHGSEWQHKPCHLPVGLLLEYLWSGKCVGMRK